MGKSCAAGWSRRSPNWVSRSAWRPPNRTCAAGRRGPIRCSTRRSRTNCATASSERTCDRDVAGLLQQGVPIEGEAGVGYRLGAGFDLPPMMFTQDEAKAIVASVRMAQGWLDPVLARGAEEALGKILSVLPVE